MSRIEQQRARRSAKVFDGDNDMVVVYAELDRIAGERVKAAETEAVSAAGCDPPPATPTTSNGGKTVAPPT